MKKTIAIFILLLVFTKLNAQFAESNAIYATGELALGNYLEANLNLNYVINEKYSLQIGYSWSVWLPKISNTRHIRERNGILYNSDGNKRIEDNALVALTLMIAVSDPAEKDIIIKVIINLINRNNWNAP